MIAKSRLSDLAAGAEAILESIELPDEEARHLMILGFLPGPRIQEGRSRPPNGAAGPIVTRLPR